jgi:hypothetical protein
MKLREELKLKLNIKDDWMSSHETDLYIRTAGPDQADQVIQFLEAKGFRWHWSVSDVKGQPWYGHMFIEVPLALISERIERTRKAVS